ncbi:MAG: hypothetical protein ACXW2I_15250 [Burkholderiales bacterium]
MLCVRLILLLACVSSAIGAQAHAQGFSFSREEQREKAAREEAEAARQERVQSLLSVPCLDKIRNQKIMVVIGEDRNGVIFAGLPVYNPHYEAINQRLSALGLRTYTPAEIRSQIRQAEMEALLRNDVKAALSASKRLAARYILRGLITTRAGRNAVVNVNQVAVNMNFTLSAADGRPVSQVAANNESFAGRDTAGMALTLINERADELVAQLYSDYCQGAGGAR